MCRRRLLWAGNDVIGSSKICIILYIIVINNALFYGCESNLNVVWNADTPGTDVTAIYLDLKDIQYVVEMVSYVHWKLRMPCWVKKYNLVAGSGV